MTATSFHCFTQISQLLTPVPGPPSHAYQTGSCYCSSSDSSQVYIAGFPDPDDVESAVRKTHGKAAEGYKVLEGGIMPGIGPQPKLGEVRILKGAAASPTSKSPINYRKIHYHVSTGN